MHLQEKYLLMHSRQFPDVCISIQGQIRMQSHYNVIIKEVSIRLIVCPF